jgi:hypothetical protein
MFTITYEKQIPTKIKYSKQQEQSVHLRIGVGPPIGTEVDVGNLV